GPLLDKEQVVANQAAQDLAKGAVLTAGLVQPAPLVDAGDLITITLRIGDRDLSTVAKAITAGARGDHIRARNEATNEIYDVIVMAKQAGRCNGANAPQDDLAATDRDSALDR